MTSEPTTPETDTERKSGATASKPNKARKPAARKNAAKNGKKPPAKTGGAKPAGKGTSKSGKKKTKPSKTATVLTATEIQDPVDDAGTVEGVEEPRLRVVTDADVEPTKSEPRWPAPARRGFGVALLGLASAGKFAAGEEHPVARTGDDLPAISLMDVGLGGIDVTLEVAEAVAATLDQLFGPVASAAIDPARRPVSGMQRAFADAFLAISAPLAKREARLRSESEAEAAAAVASVLPPSMDTVLDQVDLTNQVVGRVDMEKVLADTFEQVDVVNIMIDKVDLHRVVHASLGQVDLTDIAIAEIDLQRVVEETLERADVFALGVEQLDPAKVANYLRDNVDLSQVIRTAPGDAVRGVMDTVNKMVPGR